MEGGKHSRGLPRRGQTRSLCEGLNRPQAPPDGASAGEEGERGRQRSHARQQLRRPQPGPVVPLGADSNAFHCCSRQRQQGKPRHVPDTCREPEPAPGRGVSSRRRPQEGQPSPAKVPNRAAIFIPVEGRAGTGLARLWERCLVPGLPRAGELPAVIPANTKSLPIHPNLSRGAADPDTGQARAQGGAERPHRTQTPSTLCPTAPPLARHAR